MTPSASTTIPTPPPSQADLAWRENWITQMRLAARSWGPAQFAPPRTTGSAPAISTMPSKESSDTDRGTPLLDGIDEPTVKAPRMTRNTEPVPRLSEDTMILPWGALSQELEAARIGNAVQRFWNQHHCLPEIVRIKPGSALSLPRAFYPVPGCENIGLYTIALEHDASLTTKAIHCESLILGVGIEYYL